MATALIDFDLVTKEIRRIIVPEHDGQLHHHPVQPQHGWGRVTTRIDKTPDNEHALVQAARAIESETGIWPPNVNKK